MFVLDLDHGMMRGMDAIEVEHRGPVTWVTLNRPEAMNSLTPELHHALQAAFAGFAADPAQRICASASRPPLPWSPHLSTTVMSSPVDGSRGETQFKSP